MILKLLIKNPLTLICASVVGVMFLTTSCGSTKGIPYVPCYQEHEIHQHLTSDDVFALIDDYKQYPEYQTRIADYLLYERDYSDESYKNLLEYKEWSINVEPLDEKFNLILRERERNILKELSEEDISDIAYYYQQHPLEESFLRPALENSILSDLYSYDYYDIHCLHHAFSQTNLASRIDSVYLVRKKAIMKVLDKDLASYCRREVGIVSAYSDNCFEELSQYIADFTPLFIEKLLEHDLPEDAYDIEVKYKRVLESQLNQEKMWFIIHKNASECADIINEGRGTFIKELMPEMYFSSYVTRNIENKGIHFSPECPIDPLMAISKIQNKTDYVGWGLTAASIITGILSMGMTSAVLGAVDVGRSIVNADEDAQAISPHIQSVADDFYQTSRPCVTQLTRIYFGELTSLIKQSQKNFKSIIHENY